MQIQHPDLVKALVKSGASIAASLSAGSADLWHGATGVAGETGEIIEAVLSHIDHDLTLDRENMVEELGDMEFYLEQVRTRLGIERDQTLCLIAANDRRLTGSLLYDAANLAAAGMKLLDLVKKQVVYNKAPESFSYVMTLAGVELGMENIRQHCGITREETIEANIAKLMVRYGSGSYSDQQAQERADKAAGA